MGFIFWRLLQRECQELFKRKWDFSLLTWIPLSIILLFPLIYRDSVPLAMPIIIVDLDHSSLSRGLTRFVTASSRIKLTASLDHLVEAQSAIRAGQASAILYIPAGSEQKSKREGAADLFLFYNSAYYTEGNFIAKEVSSIVGGFNKNQVAPTPTGNFVVNRVSPKSIAPLKVQLTSLFNSSNSYQWGLVSIIYPALLHLIMAAIFAVSFFRDYYTPQREKWLRLAGNSIGLAYLGKILFFALWFAALSSISTLYMVFLGWPVNGSLVALLGRAFLMYVAYLFGASLIVLLLKDKLNTALSIISLFTSPALAYGNILFPVHTGSGFVRFFSGLLPYTHYIDIQAHSWLGNASLSDNFHQLSILLASCLFAGAFAFWLVLRFLSQPLFLDSEAEDL